MVGFNVTCHKLGLWAGKALAEEGPPRSVWHLLVAAQIVGTWQKEDYSLAICLLGLPSSAGLFTLLLLLLM